MKAGRIAFRAVLIAVISVTLGLGVYNWNAKRVFNNAMPMPFGTGVSVILSGSMEPTLHVNDLVIIREADAYEMDDIVVYQSGSSLVIHRIVGINEEENKVTTKGDANNIEDGEIPVTAIKGKLSFSIPFIGILIRFMKSVPGVILILAAAAFLMIRSWKKEKEEDNRELDAIKAEIAKLKGEDDASSPEALEEQIRKLKEELKNKNDDQ